MLQTFPSCGQLAGTGQGLRLRAGTNDTRVLGRQPRLPEAEAAKTGHLRTDIPPDELASYCLHALSAAANAPSKPGVQRVVDLTLAGLKPTGEIR